MKRESIERRVCAATRSASDGGEPAREVRLYHYGWNDDTTGSLFFDEQAASLVMAAFTRKRVPGMVDLEHMSLDDTAPNWDGDARGSYRLEVRRDANGKPELWAVIDWAPDGEQRIREKRQRFLSPVVEFFKDSKRICRIFNIALCANPATHGAQPLIAASERTRAGASPAPRKGRRMAAEKVTAETLTKLMEAYGLAPDAGVGELTALLQATVMELQGQPQPTEGTPVEGDAAADDPEPKPEPGEEEDPDHVMAAASHKLTRVGLKSVAHNLDAIAVGVSMVLRKTGTKSLSAALERIDTFKASHVAQEEGEAKLKAGHAKLEDIERRKLVADLVKLKSETPATAFVDSLEERPTICKRLADEPIDELRGRVLKLNGGKPVVAEHAGASKPPANDGADVATLTARELRMCAELKVDPKVYAADKVARAKKKAG